MLNIGRVEKEAWITAGLAALTFMAVAGWFFMARRPAQWAVWVDRENDFWRSKGLLSAVFAEKLKRWEKSKTLSILAGITALIGLVGFSLTLMVWIKAIALQHQRIRMPYNPALHLKPKPPAQTNARPKPRR